jgi:hypothetical protein
VAWQLHSPKYGQRTHFLADGTRNRRGRTGMASVIPRKLAICVTAFYDERRLGYLEQASAHFRELADEVIIFLVTNTGDTEERARLRACVEAAGNSCSFCTPSGLGHPYLLPWAHFTVFRRLYAEDASISHFMYIEDDTLVTRDAIEYWVEWHAVLNPVRLIPSFLRVEKKRDDDRWYSTDCIQPVRISNASKASLDDKIVFVNLPNPYQGMYLLDRALMGEHLSGSSSGPDFGPWPIREKAAQGLTFANPPTGFSSRNVVPYLPGARNIDERCFVHHLPNNYANNDSPSNPFGKVLVTDVLIP